MILTDDKITVTYEMMEQAGMTRYGEFGVPDGKGGLKWRHLMDLKDEDFETIENYFLIKKTLESNPLPSSNI